MDSISSSWLPLLEGFLGASETGISSEIIGASDASGAAIGVVVVDAEAVFVGVVLMGVVFKSKT